MNLTGFYFCDYSGTQGGSAFKVNAIISGELQFGVAQSDRQYQAVNGLAEWKDRGKIEKLRSVFSIHPESVTLIAAVDADIETITDLNGKRVNMGNPGSGHRQNAIDDLEAVGIDYSKDIKAESIKAAESANLLQDNRIDAFFYTVGHPNRSIKEATSGKRKVRFVSIVGIGNLLEKYPYYAASAVPIQMYPGTENREDVKTFGVKGTIAFAAATQGWFITKNKLYELPCFLMVSFILFRPDLIAQWLNLPHNQRYWTVCLGIVIYGAIFINQRMRVKADFHKDT